VTTATSGDERGVAALELGLMLTALFLVAVLLAPIPYAMVAKTRLERAAGRAARFATQVPDRSRPGLPAGQRRPTVAEVAAEAAAAYGGPGTLGPAVVTFASGDPTCPRTRSATVAMTATVDLGPFSGLYSIAGVGTAGTMTVSATATNCQE